MKKTNLLIIMSDEHNPFISGFAGDPYVSTPNLDRLAKSGTVFSSAYCNSPICVPARASFATGLTPHQTECWDNAHGYFGQMKSWGHVLQDNNLRVESIGKLHYKNAEADTGFDKQNIPMHIKGPGMLWGLLRDPLVSFEKQAAGMLRPIGPGYSPYNQYDENIADQACQWLDTAAKQHTEEPWTLYVGLVAPHFPLTVPEEFIQPYLEMDLPEPRLRPEAGYVRHPWVEDMAFSMPVDESLTPDERKMAVASYYGLVSFMDYQVGKILSRLESTGLSENTRIIYTSDHGDNVGVRGLWGKCTMNDDSAGIPMIISGPDIPQGQTKKTPVSLVDIYPTVLDVTGAQEQHFDGHDRSANRSLMRLARDNNDEDRTVLSEYHAVGSRHAAYMLRNKKYKYVHYIEYAPELFDMEQDPYEESDLAGLPEYSEIIQAFETQLREMLDPESVDAKARAAQEAMIAKHGGKEACLSGGPQGATPVPDIIPHEQ